MLYILISKYWYLYRYQLKCFRHCSLKNLFSWRSCVVMNNLFSIDEFILLKCMNNEAYLCLSKAFNFLSFTIRSCFDSARSTWFEIYNRSNWYVGLIIFSLSARIDLPWFSILDINLLWTCCGIVEWGFDVDCSQYSLFIIRRLYFMLFSSFKPICCSKLKKN